MRRSAAIALWGIGSFFFLGIVGEIFMPSALAYWLHDLANYVAFPTGVISSIVWAYVNLADERMANNIYNAPVDNRSINAVSSNVATDGSTINQSTEINNSGEIGSSLSELKSLIKDSDLAGNDQKYAQLLLESIENESLKSNKNKHKLSEQISEFGSIIESSASLASSGMKALNALQSLVL